MKFITLFILTALVCLLADATDEGGDRQKDGWRPISHLNSSVQTLLSASLVQLTSNQTVYLWDTLNLVTRFLLLNQTQLSATSASNATQLNMMRQHVQLDFTPLAALSYNVTQQAELNVSNLNWTALPANVQAFLTSQSVPIIYNLTFNQWAWVDANDRFGDSTLFSLLSAKAQYLAANLSTLLAPLTFGLQIDRSALNQKLYAAHPNRKYGDLASKFFESFYKSLSKFLPHENERSKRREEPGHQTAFSTFDHAVRRALKFLNSLKQ